MTFAILLFTNQLICAGKEANIEALRHPQGTMADDDANETKYNDGNSNNNEKTAEDNHESELGPEYQGKILGPSIFQQNIVQRPITKSRNYLEYGYTTQFNIDISNIDEV